VSTASSLKSRRRRQPLSQIARCLSPRRFVRSPSPPAPFEVGIVAAKPALRDQHCNVRGCGGKAALAASSSMCASLGSSGKAAIERPWAVTRPSGSIAPSVVSRFLASSTAALGGGVREQEPEGRFGPRAGR
jgi:hypothetical protein